MEEEPKPSMAARRTAANALFSKGMLAEAAAAYEDALALLDVEQSEVAETVETRNEEAVKCLGNLCTVHHKLGNRDETLRAAHRAIALQPAYAKGLAFWGMCAVEEEAQRFDAQLQLLSGAEDKPGLAALDVIYENICEAYKPIAAALLLAPVTFSTQLAPTQRKFAEVSLLYSEVNKRIADQEGAVEEVRGTEVISGIGIKAKDRIPMHRVVAYLTRPVCIGYYADSLGDGLCVCCGQTQSSQFLKCERCNCVAYCSTVCQTEYNDRHTNFECAHFRNLRQMMAHIEATEKEAPEDLIEIGTALITALSAIRCSHPDSYLFDTLEHHGDEVTHVLGKTVPLLINLLAFDDPRRIQRICGVVRCNSIQISDASGLGRGQAVFGGFASRFNHSCSPNAAIDYENRCIRTTRAVAAGSEITISYTPVLYQPTYMRRTTLSDRFFFICRCPRCVSNDRAELLLRGVLVGARADAETYFRPTVLATAESARSLSVEEVSPSVLEDLQEQLKKVQEHCLPTHYLVQELRNAITFAATVLNRREDVQAHARDELLLWELLVPGALPVKLDKLRNLLLAAVDDSEKTELWNALATAYDHVLKP